MSKSSSAALTRFLLCTTAATAALCAPAVALADDGPAAKADSKAQPEEPKAGDAPNADEVELSDDGIADTEEDMEFASDIGADENPTDPNAAFGKKEEESTKTKAAKTTSGYPARVIERPLNLPGSMVQVGLEIPVNFDPFAVSGKFSGDYGITKDVQVGLEYSPGRYADDFSVGRAVAINAQYLIVDEVAAQVSIPMYLDPFALGVILAAPIKYTLFDSFSLVAGEDFFSFKIHEFLPSVDNATANDALIAARDANTIVPVYAFNLQAGAIYQLDDAVALDAQFGTRFDDTNNAATSSLEAGLLYAKTNKLDFGARLDASDLSNISQSLALRLFLNIRI